MTDKLFGLLEKREMKAKQGSKSILNPRLELEGYSQWNTHNGKDRQHSGWHKDFEFAAS